MEGEEQGFAVSKAKYSFQLCLDAEKAREIKNIAHGVLSLLQGFLLEDDFLMRESYAIVHDIIPEAVVTFFHEMWG